MKLKLQPTFAFASAISLTVSFAQPGLATTLTFPAAAITTSLDQCVSQTCGSFPPLANYSGPLSGFPGTQTVGEGAFTTVSAFSSPSLSSQVPTAGANALVNSELTYYIAVVPVGGGSSINNVQLGVNSVGSISVTTVSNAVNVSNDASDFTNVQLALLSASSGTAVFNDTASIVYSASENAQGTCITSNTSSAEGAGTVSTPGSGGATVGCGTSFMFGGFNETGSYTVSSNTLYEVVMQANLHIGTSNDGLAHGTGTVQGNATVDPIFTAPSGYMIELSAGVGNTLTSTPEPATWVLFAAGMGLLGVVARQRRRRSVE